MNSITMGALRPQELSSSPSCHLPPFRLAAYGLVGVSACLGATFGWLCGQSHGVWFSALFAAAALGAEALKPVAVARAVRGPHRVLACLAVAVTVAFSLTSEIGLMALTRGDGAATRVHDANMARVAEARLANIRSELATVAHNRDVPNVTRDLETVKLDPLFARSNSCTTVTKEDSRAFCARVVALQAELELARRRMGLVRQLDEAEKAVLSAPVAGAADPLASAIASYLGEVGFEVAPDRVAPWLYLVLPLLLEVWTVAGLLLTDEPRGHRGARTAASRVFGEFGHPDPESPASGRLCASDAATGSRSVVGALVGCTLSHPLPPERVRPEAWTGRSTVGGRPPAVGAGSRLPAAALPALMSAVERAGGRLHESQAAMAARIGSNRTALQLALRVAAEKGLLAVETVKGHSTSVRLVKRRLAAA